MQPSPIDHLTRAVTAMHGSPCSHVRTVRVHEVMDGKTVWEGNVEVFDLAKHPKAKQAFAWSYKDDHGETQYLAVLCVPPILSPREAVQAAIASGKQE